MAKARGAKQSARGAKSTMRKHGLTTGGKGSRVNDVAAVSETYMFNPTQMDVIYFDYGCNLQQHLRASTVAAGYQEFRIKLIEYKLKPLSDTYAPGSGVVPYLYYLVDKLRANNNLLTLDGFKKAGAKPIRFDDKTITIKYKPSVLLDAYDAAAPAGGVPRQYRISPWLATNDNNNNPGVFVPSAIDHNGLRWIIDGTSAEFTYTIERVVHIEFRKPMWTELAGETVSAVSVETLVPPKVPQVPEVPPAV